MPSIPADQRQRSSTISALRASLLAVSILILLLWQATSRYSSAYDLFHINLFGPYSLIMDHGYAALAHYPHRHEYCLVSEPETPENLTELSTDERTCDGNGEPGPRSAQVLVSSEPRSVGMDLNAIVLDEESPVRIDVYSDLLTLSVHQPVYQIGNESIAVHMNCFRNLGLAILAALLVLRLVAMAKRRIRVIQGKCPRCGYDIASNPSRCPECGAVLLPRGKTRPL